MRSAYKVLPIAFSLLLACPFSSASLAKDPIIKSGEKLIKGDIPGAAREIVKPTDTATKEQEEKHKQDAIRENMAKCGRPTYCN